MAIDHIDHLQLVVMQRHRRSRAAVFNDQDIEAFIGQTSYRAADALIREDSRHHYIPDADIVQNESQVGSGQSTVSRLGNDNFIALGSQFWYQLAVLTILGQQKIIETRFLLVFNDRSRPFSVRHAMRA